MQVSIFLCRETLAEFKLTSPTLNVTSLKVRNTAYSLDISLANHLLPEDEEFMRSFMDY